MGNVLPGLGCYPHGAMFGRIVGRSATGATCAGSIPFPLLPTRNTRNNSAN